MTRAARRSDQHPPNWSLSRLFKYAQRYGSDGLGTGGARGYLGWLCEARPAAFAQVLMAYLPRTPPRSIEELIENLREIGWSERYVAAWVEVTKAAMKDKRLMEIVRKLRGE